MSEESATQKFPPVVKPLLLDSLGTSFLAYVLGADEGEIEQWLTSDEDSFGTPAQTNALLQLHLILHSQQDSIDDDKVVRQLNLSSILGIYQPQFHTTLVNVIRLIALEQELATSVPKASSPAEILTALIQDTYPLYLLPSERVPFSPSSVAMFRHPFRDKFEAAIMGDEIFSQIFSKDDDPSDQYAHLVYSTGHAGGIQLSMLAETVINAGWRAAQIDSLTHPSIERHVESTLTQLTIMREVISGKTVMVSARVAFTGVRLASDKPVDLGWGVLRPVDGRDRHLIPQGLAGQKLSGTRADGESVTVDYSGDVVLDTTVEYRVINRKLDFSNEEWPKELRVPEQLQYQVENIEISALLSQEFNAAEPITVISTWRYIHDPFAHGFNSSWNDPRMSRPFIPKQLSENDTEEWRKYLISIKKYRTKSIDVAIRRTLRASVERRDFADVLVDAVIAWENLFGAKVGEPTIRVTGSLAWLLEDDAKKRIALRGKLSKVYGMRSDVVHGNTAPSKQEIVSKAQDALGTAISALRILFTTRLELLQECNDGLARSNRLLMGD